MRSFAALALPVAFAAAARVGRDVADRKWSYMPDKTANWYKSNGKPLPELAQTITTVEESQSYIVKLECLGCPFRVRSTGQVYETWQEPAQDNSLLLNFTIDGSDASLLLNGERIAPEITLPLPISAFQTPANLSAEIMEKMASQHMLDSSWVLGTKYGRFELQYEHTLLATNEASEEWVQFDVTGAYRRGINPGGAKLDKDGQKMVQLLLHQEANEDKHTLSIKDIQVVERKDRVQPLRMKCGKLAMIWTEYNPLEWDHYGKFGTLTRSWHVVAWKSVRFFARNFPTILLFCLLFSGYSLVRWHIRQRLARAAEIKDDAEAGLLVPEYDDAPPDYTDASEGVEEKDDDGR